MLLQKKCGGMLIVSNIRLCITHKANLILNLIFNFIFQRKVTKNINLNLIKIKNIYILFKIIKLINIFFMHILQCCLKTYRKLIWYMSYSFSRLHKNGTCRKWIFFIVSTVLLNLVSIFLIFSCFNCVRLNKTKKSF